MYCVVEIIKCLVVKSGGTNKNHLRFQGLIEPRNHVNILSLYPAVSKRVCLHVGELNFKD